MTRKDTIAFFQFIWRMTGARIILAFTLMLVGSLTEGISLLLLIPIVASLAPEGSGMATGLPIVGDALKALSPSLTTLLLVFVILVVMQALLARWRTLYTQKMTFLATEKMKVQLFSAMSEAEWGAISTRRNADLNHALVNDTDRMFTAANASLTILQSLILLSIYLLLAAGVSWRMAAMAVVVGAVFFLVLYPIRRLASKHGKTLTDKLQTQNQIVLEFIANIRLAKLFTSEDNHSQAYRRHLAETRKEILGFSALAQWGTVFFQIGTAIIAAAFVWVAVQWLALDLARLGVLLVIFARVAPRFSSIQTSITMFLSSAHAYLNYRDMARFFESHRESDPETQAPAPRLTQSLQFADISVQYKGAKAPALSCVNATIKAGTITALIGQSGAGKSTMGDLIMGLTQPSEGALLIDGQPLEDTNRRAWRRSVACVPQDAFLMNDTIAANLRIGKPAASEDEIWRSLDQANAGDLVRGLPDGLETMAGDRGGRFSGGERQRLALARALLRQPQLLVLDEATSALDWENQSIIADAIQALRGELTIVTIAHRSSLITIADDVIALDKGKLVAQGRFAEMKGDPGSPLSALLAGDIAASGPLES
ncbi:MAG: ABC transporter ATP-binding protein [Pseudomonadota bacterium]